MEDKKKINELENQTKRSSKQEQLDFLDEFADDLKQLREKLEVDYTDLKRDFGQE